MEFVLDPPMCAKTGLQYMRMTASLAMSAGDAALTPTAIQWALKVRVYANGSPLPFDFTENLLRCFVGGSFVTNWARECEDPMYEQEKAGFRVVFPRKNNFPPAAGNRREVREIRIGLEFCERRSVFADQSELFQDTLELVDYGFCAWMHVVQALAPAVFSSAYKRIATVQPLLRPVKLALGLSRDSIVLEHLTERGVLSATTGSLVCSVGRSGPQKADHCRKRGLDCAENESIECQRLGEMRFSAQDRHPYDRALSPALVDLALQNSRDPTGVIEWHAPGEFFQKAPFESRRFVVLNGDSDVVHECVFLSQLISE